MRWGGASLEFLMLILEAWAKREAWSKPPGSPLKSVSYSFTPSLGLNWGAALACTKSTKEMYNESNKTVVWGQNPCTCKDLGKASSKTLRHRGDVVHEWGIPYETALSTTIVLVTTFQHSIPKLGCIFYTSVSTERRNDLHQLRQSTGFVIGDHSATFFFFKRRTH